MEKIQQLIEVQQIDKEIYSNRKRLKQIPTDIEALKTRVEEETAALKALEESRKDVQRKQKEREVELSSKEENIKKLEGQLNLVKTNKEYSALQSEIRNLKSDNTIAEEEILKVMEESESYLQKIEDEKKRLREVENEFKTQEKKLLDEKKSTEEEVTNFQNKKKEMVASIDPEVLSTYERVLEKKEGLALVPAVHGGCGGCGLQLRPQVVNQLQMKSSVITCEKCARILYIPEEAPKETK